MKKARRKRHIACDGLQGAVKTDIFTMSKTAAHRAAANCESSEAGHSWNGGTRERADDVLLFCRNKRTSEQSRLCSDVERVRGIEPPSPAWKAGALAVVLHLQIWQENVSLEMIA